MFKLIPLLLLALGVEAQNRPIRLWTPEVGEKWQIILNSTIAINRTTNLVPKGVRIWEVDLFDTPRETIRELKRRGNRVICYFSAGTTEDWRPDFRNFTSEDKGACLPEWVGERYVDIRKPSVFNLMRERIRLAGQKGCDAIDPDNIDVFSNEQGFATNITRNDAIAYFRKLADEARQLRISTGLKNAQPMLPSVQDVVQFAVNEECTIYNELTPRPAEPPRGKAVFHVEYANFKFDNQSTSIGAPEISNDDIDQLKNMSSRALYDKYCNRNTEFDGLFSTTIKIMNLDGQVLYCDGQFADTKMMPLNPILKGWAGECNLTKSESGAGVAAANGTLVTPPFANATSTTIVVTPNGPVVIPTAPPKQPRSIRRWYGRG
ncbi:hypothetical protein EJ08DRAFT_577361 [Tothia fuscella]|uniref:alpha-galactosidase n=1 Tax=Tothia fuscella TaxID=1048955 RepID=A0A9P4P3X0_9PEZI|nr:hypothetical protein EJ08DRAFT_577361 [Tothia fuscella]